MSSDEKIIEGGGEGSSHNTPQEITITIMAPSALETTSIDSSALVASVTSQEIQPDSSVLVVPSENVGNISVTNENKDLIQTVTETHMGSEDLPVISNISSEDTASGTGNSIPVVNKDGGDENVDDEDLGMDHCLVCDIELSGEKIPVFKSLTTSSHRKVSIFLGGIVGQTLTSRKVHSCSLCVGCFGLLNKLDLLEIQVQETKTTLETNFQETLTKHGGRARRKKPAAAKKSDYVFPKIEADDEDQDAIALEMDETFEPRADDLMEEEHDRKEDRELHDEEWEPNEFKKPRAKRDASSSSDPNGQPKRKRGRPRKDAPKKVVSKTLKDESEESEMDIVVAGMKEIEDLPSVQDQPFCPLCKTKFSFESQLRRHVKYEHPDHDMQVFSLRPESFINKDKLDIMVLEIEDPIDKNLTNLLPKHNLSCPFCKQQYDDKDKYDSHLKTHGENAYQNYLQILKDNLSEISNENCSSLDKDSKEDSKENGKAIKCHLCNAVTDNEWTLQFHLDECHKNDSRTCVLCNEQCSDISTLQEHLIHHFYGFISCPICHIRFSVRQHIISHISARHPNCNCFLCSDCNKEFETYELCEKHRMNDHGKGSIRVCKICGKGVLAFDFYKHLKEHHYSNASSVSKPHSCDLGLSQHKYHDHPEIFHLKCVECERRFKSDRLLRLHRWGHKYGKHQCPVCWLKFRQVDQLKKHLSEAHPEENGYTCKYCPNILKNYTTYIAHLKLKHPKESGYKRPVLCKLCGKTFDHKMQWNYHKRIHNQELQTCNVCGITVKNLHAHMNLHTRDKKFECRVCGVVYHNKASFHFHIKRVHMGEKVRKYICNICKKSFLTPADHQIHIDRVHNNVRNFWCNICNKGYKSQVSLTYHARLHTGEKPHKCTLCEKSFRIPSYLKRHMEMEHRVQYPGVYFKKGRSKDQVPLGRSIRKSRKYNSDHFNPPDGSIPEVVQITVPMEMGDEVVAAVNSVRSEESKAFDSELQDGIVYLVCE